MDLKEFVSESLSSIVDGTKDAQEKTIKKGASIKPERLMRHKTMVKENAVWDNKTNNYAQTIPFGIA